IRDLMAMGALQDKPLESIQAEVNIQSNPLPIEEYQLLKDYWPNISMRVPAILPTINPTTPVINELMASNGDFITDYQGDSEDWIEIYNPLNQPLDISRYYLSDDFENLLKWSFPEGTIIPTKGFIIVFASGKDLVATNGEIHTNFKINDEGESIILTSKDQQSILDYIPSTEIPRNYSYGRAVDGGNTWVYFDLMNSSPEETNNNSTPYSEDGSVIPDDLSTNIENFNRLFNDDIEKSIIIKITEEEWNKYDQEMLDYQSLFNDLRTDYYAKADFVYEDEEGQVSIGNVGFRTRGNFSRVRIQNDDGSLNMSNFKISFHETFDQIDLATNKSRTVFEVEELDMKWNRNYDDTYLTEKFSLDLMREFGVHAANATLAKVYLEISGERHFYGVYTIFEPIDELFIEKRFTGESNDGDLYKSLWQQFGPASLRTGYHPNAIGIKDESINYRPTYDIKTNKDSYDRSALESFIYNVSDTYGNDFYNYIKDHFDVDRFLRYLAVGVLLGNPDDYRAMANNYYLYHDPLVDKWTIIPYDYDHGMGQGWDGAPVFENWTIDADIYEWGNLNAFQEGKDYSNPLSKKILEIPEYQIIYEGYLAELINPDNNYFNFNHFNEMFENQKNLYQSSLSEAMMSLDFGLRNIHWYFEEKTASVSSQLSYYQTNPDRRP
ncbi:MAG: CotH kinase family protein, partial [Candidatus Izemoplasmatales bacterium]|nr:CotH kinase family protein [Candidatus Izemoplasmatales bacterium]